MIALAAASCSPNNNTPSPNPGNNPGNTSGKFWIPNWAKDTLLGLRDMGTFPAEDPIYDIIYTDMSGDTSLVYYQGAKYYIWTEPIGGQFIENSLSYGFVVMSKYPFTNDPNKVLASGLGASPHRYYDSDYGTWHEQTQFMIIDLKPPFPEWVYMGYYSNEYKWMIE